MNKPKPPIRWEFYGSDWGRIHFGRVSIAGDAMAVGVALLLGLLTIVGVVIGGITGVWTVTFAVLWIIGGIVALLVLLGIVSLFFWIFGSIRIEGPER